MNKKVKINLKANDSDDFVGFEYKNSNITIYYPITLNIFNNQPTKELDFDKDKEEIKLLSIFMHSFRLAVAKDRVDDQSPSDNDKSDVIDYPIEAYEYMIDDYRRNGRYIEFETKSVLNGNGIIDWKRTIRQQPLIVDDKAYYTNIVTKQKRIVSNILNDIYLFCVYDSIYKFGSWFYGMNHNSIPTKAKQLSPSIKKLYLHTLDEKIRETFNDDTLNRLQNMKMIVNGAKESSGVQRMGLKTYHSVFERLIKWGLDNVGDLKEYNPRAEWNKKEIAEGDEDITDNLSPLRLDALRIEDNKAYIIDAKFYQKTKPGVADINKQITYGENLYFNASTLSRQKMPYNKENIFNVFIAPRTANYLNGNIVVDSGEVAESKWKTNNKSFESIRLFYVDLNKLLCAWYKNDKKETIFEFNELIKKEDINLPCQ